MVFRVLPLSSVPLRDPAFGEGRKPLTFDPRLVTVSRLCPLDPRPFFDFRPSTALKGDRYDKDLRPGACGYDAGYDLDGDQEVGFGDFLIFAKVFGRSVADG